MDTDAEVDHGQKRMNRWIAVSPRSFLGVPSKPDGGVSPETAVRTDLQKTE